MLNENGSKQVCYNLHDVMVDVMLMVVTTVMIVMTTTLVIASVNNCNAKKVGAFFINFGLKGGRRTRTKYKMSGGKNFCEMSRCRTKTTRQRTRRRTTHIIMCISLNHSNGLY